MLGATEWRATLGGGAVLLAVLLASGAPEAGEAVHRSQPVTLPPRGAPTQPYGERPPEEFLRYATRPVVIGCATLRSERRFEFVANH